MKRMLEVILIAAVITSVLPFLSFSQGKSIYGNDDRLDYFQVPDDIAKLADSTVSLWRSKKVIRDGEVFNLVTKRFGRHYKLCISERFRDQPVGAFCSGALVSDDIIVTAGHCITDGKICADTKFIFGFSVRRDGVAAATVIPADEVYSCKKLIRRNHNPDYALIQLDRKVKNHRPLAINRNKSISKGDELFVIGHPNGLPLKVAGNARVYNTSKRSFTANLDVFDGNSGSAVFNAKTKLIEGVLTGGMYDFEQAVGGCVRSIVWTKEGDDRGAEEITRISVLARHIPAIKTDNALKAAEVRDINVDDFVPPAELSGFDIKFE